MNSTTPDGGEICLRRQPDAYWPVAFDVPPVKSFGTTHIPQLAEIVAPSGTQTLVVSVASLPPDAE